MQVLILAVFFEVYGFAGPMLSVAKSQNVTIKNDGTMVPEGESKARARIGASAGVGLKFNINKYWAIDVEARGAIAPSIFGNISSHRKAEGTGMLTAGVSYIFGGKKFAKVEDRVVEKEVIKEVIREVPKEVVKEVIKEVPSAAEVAIFFKIGKAKISPEGMVNVQLMAKAIKLILTLSTKLQVSLIKLQDLLHSTRLCLKNVLRLFTMHWLQKA